MNTNVVIDTDVISFILKSDSRAQLYHLHLQGKRLAVAFMTVAELYQWAYARQWGKAKLAWLEQQLKAYVIVPYNNELCRRWAEICVTRQRKGMPISAQDAWIAATALQYQCPLITHNRNDFMNIPGLVVISEAP